MQGCRGLVVVVGAGQRADECRGVCVGRGLVVVVVVGEQRAHHGGGGWWWWWWGRGGGSVLITAN